MAEAVMHQIFSYFVKNVTEVNRIAVFVRYMIEELGRTAAKKTQSIILLAPPVSARGQQRRVLDAETKQLTQMVVVIYIRFEKLLK